MKVWVEAQQLETVGRDRAPVALEGVGRWIMATDLAVIVLTSLIVGYGYHSLVLGQPAEIIRYLTIGAMFAAAACFPSARSAVITVPGSCSISAHS